MQPASKHVGARLRPLPTKIASTTCQYNLPENFHYGF
jgi:hypothetical protein